MLTFFLSVIAALQTPGNVVLRPQHGCKCRSCTCSVLLRISLKLVDVSCWARLPVSSGVLSRLCNGCAISGCQGPSTAARRLSATLVLTMYLYHRPTDVTPSESRRRVPTSRLVITNMKCINTAALAG